MYHDWMKLVYDRICWSWERLEAEEIPAIYSIWLKYKSEKQEIVTRNAVKIETQNKTIDWVLVTKRKFKKNHSNFKNLQRTMDTREDVQEGK